MPEKETRFRNAVDCIFDINNGSVLLVKRKVWPFEGYWALPGGRQESFQTLHNALVNALRQRLNMDVEIDSQKVPGTIRIKDLGIEEDINQIRTYDSGTDPRGGNTTVYAVQLKVDEKDFLGLMKPGERVTDVMICEWTRLPKLAFDHKKFIEEYFRYHKPRLKALEGGADYGRPSLMTGVAAFTFLENGLRVLLVKRAGPPLKGKWALPVEPVLAGERPEDAARRGLSGRTGAKDVYIEQLYTTGGPGSGEGAMVTVTYLALIGSGKATLRVTPDVTDAAWFPVDRAGMLTPEHRELLRHAVRKLGERAGSTTTAFRLLPEEFTLTQLQGVYEALAGERFDKRNFRRKALSLGILEQTGGFTEGASHRPARLYRLRKGAGERIDFM